MYCKENLFFFVSDCFAITNHRAYSPLEIGFPWIGAHSIFYPIFSFFHPFLHVSPPLFFFFFFVFRQSLLK